MAKKLIKPYYTEYKLTLKRKLTAVRELIYPEQGVMFQDITPEAKSLIELEKGITKFPLRFYQNEAIYTLHSIYKQALNVCRSPEDVQKELLKKKEYEHIKPLLEVIDEETGRKAPFIGFEMATGSGKTMLMGASVYYLNKHHNVKNFLIITPSSTEIYKKTIRNFQIGSKESVWNDDVPFKFNLITGDNYKESKDLFSSETDANIFIFNIDKFGANAVQTKKEWERSVWKDKIGNTISLLDFLSLNDLVIITDEAHHAQSTKAKKIISDFKPLAVMEFTATAVESEKNKDKKNQTIVYKYDIKRFLEDGHGKRVRVLALPSEDKRTSKSTTISNAEKLKLQTFFLVHFVKKKALTLDVACRGLKAIGFVKVKNEIKFAQKVEEYIKSELASDTENLEIILEKSKIEDTETTKLILDLFENEYQSNIELLQRDIQQVAANSILLHSQSDPLVKRQFDLVQSNEVEIVIFIDMLNEGIDMPNIYTMVVINDTPTEFKTAVKQIVGRGVRLNKEKRIHDDVTDNDLLTHTEKLHIICDKGAAFEEVVLAIQKEFGLNDKNFSMESGEEMLIDNPVKVEKLKGIQVPKVRVDFKRKKDVSIQDVIQNHGKIIQDFLDHNCFPRTIEGNNYKFLRYAPNNFFIEIDLFADEKVFSKLGEEQGWHYETLVIEDKDIKEIYGRIVSRLKPIPDVPNTFKIFKEYQARLNQVGICFYNIDEVDFKLSKQRFKDSFVYFYMNYVEKMYFELDLDTLDTETNTWILSNQFQSSKIKVRKKEIKNNTRVTGDEKRIKECIKSGYYFYGYENSAYEYDKFDSYPEKKLADYVNHLINQKSPEERKQPFWVRNDRNIYFEYGSHKYYPDFLFFYNRIIYVIEIKGEKFSNAKKNALLIELKNAEGVGQVESYKGVVVFEAQMDKLHDFNKDFDAFILEAEQYFEMLKTRDTVVAEEDVPEGLKFVSFVPAYEPGKAYSKFIQGKDVKPNGWFEVPRKESGYSEKVYATLVKTADLGPNWLNKWILMTSEILPDIGLLDGKTIMCSYNKITDSKYPKNITIRKVRLEEKLYKTGIFEEKEKFIHLLGENDDYTIPVIKNNKFEVFGIQYEITDN
jgi:superfamily II DNA or RNA helicase